MSLFYTESSLFLLSDQLSSCRFGENLPALEGLLY